jgi:UDP-glucose 4-epimerase
MTERVLLTGMGSELGTRVALLLEGDTRIRSIVGVDGDPPRRRLHRAEFHRVDPRDNERLAALVRDVDPTAVVHLGVYEPNARAGPAAAAARTDAMAAAVFGAAVELRGIRRIVVRSGIEIYGRRRGAPAKPDERAPVDPTSPFGASVARVERVAASAGVATGAPVTCLRVAPLVGSHLASPLGRYLRLPAVPVRALADPPFCVLHIDDGAAAVVAALGTAFDGPVNVVGAGSVTPVQAARLGGRVPIPVCGPTWMLVRVATEFLGAPLPDHVHELLTRGRLADGSLVRRALGVVPRHSTPDVVKELYEWAPVVVLRPDDHAAA